MHAESFFTSAVTMPLESVAVFAFCTSVTPADTGTAGAANPTMQPNPPTPSATEHTLLKIRLFVALFILWESGETLCHRPSASGIGRMGRSIRPLRPLSFKPARLILLQDRFLRRYPHDSPPVTSARRTPT